VTNRSPWMQNLRWQEIADYLQHDDTVIIPIGATEQHAYHLPLGVDSMVASGLAEEAAKQTGVLVAPPIWAGWSPHHLAYPGTISLRPETVTSVLVDYCLSLIWHGFKRIIIVNGHRIANMPPLQIAAAKVRNRTGAYVGVVDPAYLGDTAAREVFAIHDSVLGHADEMETSHMMHLHPDLVRLDLAVDNPGHPRPFHIVNPFVQADRVYAPSSIASYRDHTAPSGGTGMPTRSSAERGKAYHDRLVAALVAYIEVVKGVPVGDVKRELDF
jgi:creatinine amidohydrolase